MIQKKKKGCKCFQSFKGEYIIKKVLRKDNERIKKKVYQTNTYARRVFDLITFNIKLNFTMAK